MNEELANIIHSSGTMTKKDSILKDPSRDRENGDEAKCRSRSTKRSPTKVVPPKPETPKTPSDPTFKSFFNGDTGGRKESTQTKSTVHPDWEGGSVIDPYALAQASPDSRLASTSKIRIEVGNIKPGINGSSTLPRGNSTSLQKSQSFSADLSPVSSYKMKSPAKVFIFIYYYNIHLNLPT